MSVTTYKWLLWQFLSAIDGGQYDYLSVHDVKSMAENDTLITFMREKMDDCDFSLVSTEDWDKIGIDFAGMANAIDEDRKFGVTEKGIVLLAAYALQGLQSALRPSETGTR